MEIIKRLDAEISHVEEIVKLRAEHAKEISALESNRLNAIRQVDVLAASTQVDRAQAAIQALAAVTASNAENLRNALTTTATTVATQLTTTVGAINERIGSLEKTAYTGMGRSALADPQIADLVIEMKKLTTGDNRREGKDQGISMTGAVILGAVTFVGGLVGIAGVLFAMFHK